MKLFDKEDVYMADTYCGKMCDNCNYRERLGCLGCKTGPGRSWQCECPLAKCCRDKGHETCDTCNFNSSCGTLRGRADLPEYRLKDLAAENERKALLAQKVPFLGKWLWYLFLLVIPMVLSNIMTNESIASWLPFLYRPGIILSILCTVVYGLILLKLSTENNHYRTSAICCFVTVALSTIASSISVNSPEASWTLIITLPAAIVSLLGEYHEYTGHSEVLAGVNNQLSEKWEKLWKWYVGAFAAMFVSIIIALIIPILALLIMLAALIALLIVSLLKVVYLYQSAKVFRDYPLE